MLKIIITLAIIAFLIAIVVIYFKEIKSFIKIKLTSSKKEKKEKPKEKKSSPQPTAEEFKPIAKTYEEDKRDSSLEKLLEEDNDFPFSIDDLMAEDFDLPTRKKQTIKNDFDDFEDIKRMLGKKYEKTSSKKDISKQIRNLPPEIKALLIDNVLKRRDDV